MKHVLFIVDTLLVLTRQPTDVTIMCGQNDIWPIVFRSNDVSHIIYKTNPGLFCHLLGFICLLSIFINNLKTFSCIERISNDTGGKRVFTFDVSHGLINRAFRGIFPDPGDQHPAVVAELSHPAVAGHLQLGDLENGFRRKQFLFNKQLKV